MQLRSRLNLSSGSSGPLQRLLGPAVAASFLFFTIKGLLWLAVGGLVAIGIF
jgi:hypothetical protein